MQRVPLASTIALTTLTMRIFFVMNFTENIFSLMYFCRKRYSSGGKLRNRKLLVKNNLKINFKKNTLLFYISIKFFKIKKNRILWVLHPWISSTKKNKSVDPVSTWQSIFEMTRLGSEATIIRLNAFIFLCRTNPCWVKYTRNSILFSFEKILYWYRIKAYLKKKLIFKLFYFIIFNITFLLNRNLLMNK